MPDRHAADDRDDLAREQRRKQREREEYLTEEKETYGAGEEYAGGVGS